MQTFVDRHAGKIVGVLSCFDRVVFKGYLSLVRPEIFERFLEHHGVLFKDFAGFVSQQAEVLKAHAMATAQACGRPFLYLPGNPRKEDLVQKIIDQDGVTSGLVCILSAVEPCQSFKLVAAPGKPRLVRADRKCLCLYFYFLDREFGLLHVRLQTWFPFTVQVCLNGHDWLDRKMTRHGLGFKRRDNAFVELEDPDRAQRFADAFVQRPWPRLLEVFARRVNPLLGTLLRGMHYYWVTDQAEYATDLIFKDHASLEDLYPKLLRHATLCLSAEDILSFLGRKLHRNFQGEVLTEMKTRWPGARVKHRMSRNWIKMYDKFGVVLRIETVINRPYEFRVRRRGKRQGKLVIGWFPLPKGVGFLPRYREVALRANQRYLEALASVEDPSDAYRRLREVCQPTSMGSRHCRGLHPLRDDDVHLFAAVLRGGHALRGFRHRDLLEVLMPSARRYPDRSKPARARLTRLIQLLRAHGLVAKIPRSRRYRVTSKGARIMGAAIYLRKEDFPDLMTRVTLTG